MTHSSASRLHSEPTGRHEAASNSNDSGKAANTTVRDGEGQAKPRSNAITKNDDRHEALRRQTRSRSGSLPGIREYWQVIHGSNHNKRRPQDVSCADDVESAAGCRVPFFIREVANWRDCPTRPVAQASNRFESREGESTEAGPQTGRRVGQARANVA